MKLQIKFTKNKELVPFDYMNEVNSYLHQVLGANNPYHDGISIHSTSFLHGGKKVKGEPFINFTNGAIWYVSSPDDNFLSTFSKNIFKNKLFIYGMELESVTPLKSDFKENKKTHIIKTKSPILLKWNDRENKKTRYYTFNDDDSLTSGMMKNILIKKMDQLDMNVSPNDFEIGFYNQYLNKKTVFKKIKNIKQLTSVSPIFVKTENKKLLETIYLLGVGNSTGSGFGFLL